MSRVHSRSPCNRAEASSWASTQPIPAPLRSNRSIQERTSISLTTGAAGTISRSSSTLRRCLPRLPSATRQPPKDARPPNLRPIASPTGSLALFHARTRSRQTCLLRSRRSPRRSPSPRSRRLGNLAEETRQPQARPLLNERAQGHLDNPRGRTHANSLARRIEQLIIDRQGCSHATEYASDGGPRKAAGASLIAIARRQWQADHRA